MSPKATTTPSPSPQGALAATETVTILSDAFEAVYAGDSDKWGMDTLTLRRTSELLSGVLGMPISAREVALCMIQISVARLVYGHHRPALTDIASWAALLDRINAELPAALTETDLFQPHDAPGGKE